MGKTTYKFKNIPYNVDAYAGTIKQISAGKYEIDYPGVNSQFKLADIYNSEDVLALEPINENSYDINNVLVNNEVVPHSYNTPGYPLMAYGNVIIYLFFDFKRSSYSGNYYFSMRFAQFNKATNERYATTPWSISIYGSSPQEAKVKFADWNVSVNYYYNTWVYNPNYVSFFESKSKSLYNLTPWDKTSMYPPTTTDNPDGDPTPPEKSNDPYDKGGDSGTGGGKGTFTDNSDPIDFPALPSVSASDSGLVTLFSPTLSQLKSLANYMWSDLFDIATFQKLFADPMDCILGLSIMPFNIPDAGMGTVRVGNISTGVSMNRAENQFINIDCGSIEVKEYWGCYLDYSPYTKAEIFLPFIGIQPLNVDDIMSKMVSIKYSIDILTGSCIAFIKCDDSVLYSYSGQCAVQVPITGSNWNQAITNALTVAGAVAVTAVSGGSATPVGGAAALGASASVTNTVVSSKPHIQKSGSLAGASGSMGIKTPYLILTRPRQALPKYQNKYTGYPSHVTEILSTLKGFTQVEKINLQKVPGMNEELNEIINLLYEGVII